MTTRSGQPSPRLKYGTVYRSGPVLGAHAVSLPIVNADGRQGFKGGVLAYPTSERLPAATGGFKQYLQGGVIVVSGPTGAVAWRCGGGRP